MTWNTSKNKYVIETASCPVSGAEAPVLLREEGSPWSHQQLDHPATDASLSQAQVPGLRGVLRKEDGKPKPGARALGPPHLPHPTLPLPPGSSVAVVVIHCDPLNPPGPSSPNPSKEGTRKKPVLGRPGGFFWWVPSPPWVTQPDNSHFTPRCTRCTWAHMCTHTITLTHSNTAGLSSLLRRVLGQVTVWGPLSFEYHPSSSRVFKLPLTLCIADSAACLATSPHCTRWLQQTDPWEGKGRDSGPWRVKKVDTAWSGSSSL